MNRLDWKEKVAKLPKKVPPLWDKPLRVRTLYVNTYVYSAMYYNLTRTKDVHRSMSRHSSVRPTERFNHRNFSRQLQLVGRRASYIYAALTETCTPSTLNLRSILQTVLNHVLGTTTTTTHFSWYHFLLQCDCQTDSGTTMATNKIQEAVSTFLQARFPSMSLQLESWFSLTEKLEAHSSFAQSVTLNLNSMEAPDQELIKWIQPAGETTQVTALSFNSSSRRYYNTYKEEKLIVRSRTKHEDKTKWKTHWAFFAKQAAKLAVAFHY
ncbi:unnamed protein product [Ambrosiozyma monospora]|uniref:Unnamed protein product n=1 Tax=Ambrosiozyma monospora TaxID=43982 RepID=A0A9W7DFJ1_AMBMO|nr:unnamed protein product [Ambrosiozyma monospora]